MNNVVLGTCVKMEINISDFTSRDLNDVDMDFYIEFYTRKSAKVTIERSKMQQMGETIFIAFVDTTTLGPGRMIADLHITYPDPVQKIPRTEVLRSETDVKIIP